MEEFNKYKESCNLKRDRDCIKMQIELDKKKLSKLLEWQAKERKMLEDRIALNKQRLEDV